MAIGTPFHTWQVVAQGGTSLGHKGTLHAGKVMAATAAEVMRNPALVEEAKQELAAKLDGQKYVSPIPADVRPSIKR